MKLGATSMCYNYRRHHCLGRASAFVRVRLLDYEPLIQDGGLVSYVAWLVLGGVLDCRRRAFGQRRSSWGQHVRSRHSPSRLAVPMCSGWRVRQQVRSGRFCRRAAHPLLPWCCAFRAPLRLLLADPRPSLLSPRLVVLAQVARLGEVAFYAGLTTRRGEAGGTAEPILLWAIAGVAFADVSALRAFRRFTMGGGGRGGPAYIGGGKARTGRLVGR